MASKVYFSKLSEENAGKLAQLLLDKKPVNDKRTAIKVHFGEKGNSRFVDPEYIRPIIDQVKQQTSDYFLTDTNTLYRGMRTNATNHKQIAEEHGFGKLNTPIVIADGEQGTDEKNVQIDKKHFKNAKIARAVHEAEAMVMVSHFKGHILYGFGAALKNLAMGGASRAGKLAMHSKISPVIGEGCTKCGVCAENCDVDAIEISEDGAKISQDVCIGCAQCIAVCPEGVIKVPWHGAAPYEAMERGSEYALAVSQNKPCVYLTFINNVTKDCDCIPDSEVIGEDIGIVAGLDPVAVDQAAYDLLKKHNGKDVFQDAGNPDGTRIIDYAEELGVGSKEYELEEI